MAALEQASNTTLAELQKVTFAEMRRVGSVKGLIQSEVIQNSVIQNGHTSNGVIQNGDGPITAVSQGV